MSVLVLVGEGVGAACVVHRRAAFGRGAGVAAAALASNGRGRKGRRCRGSRDERLVVDIARSGARPGHLPIETRANKMENAHAFNDATKGGVKEAQQQQKRTSINSNKSARRDTSTARERVAATERARHNNQSRLALGPYLGADGGGGPLAPVHERRRGGPQGRPAKTKENKHMRRRTASAAAQPKVARSASSTSSRARVGT